ncbi:cell wall-binding repeat-containing protein [Candidatus Poriferisodalis sp.]|uniref:cell wall-binding repeat-containing protein n=1 Tax=Candidatus Poriferisodalis sp. TaxID=3101277 RepID=UPI003AF5D053
MRRHLALVTALLVASASVLVPATAAGAVQTKAEVDVSRYGGADRYATSLLVADAVAAHGGGTLDSVVMVSGQNWTDAVVAAPLAGSLAAPVLTTPPGMLRADTAAFLQRTGVSHALIVGADSDTDGVGPTVEASLEALGINVERVTRSDQYATSVAAAQRLGEPGYMGILGRTAIVASGEVFADALVAGAFAARGPHPVLLTPPGRLHQGVADYLVRVGTEHVVIMGGTGALGQPVEDALAALGVRVTRLAGKSRYDTAVQAAELVVHTYHQTCFTTRRVGLARARVPFDSFSAAPLLARLCAPLLLADPGSIHLVTANYLDRRLGDNTLSGDNTLAAYIFGGDSAISAAAIDAYLARGTGEVTCDIELGDEPVQVQVFLNLGGVRAAWSPDCSRIAYDDKGNLWTAQADGSDPVQLTFGARKNEGSGTWSSDRSRLTFNTQADFSPVWSPDGARIAFLRYTGVWIQGDEPVDHIYVINADGTGEVQLTDADATDKRPSFSPDGQRVVFERLDLEGDPSDPDSGWSKNSVMIIDADGRNETRVYQGGGGEVYPRWTPDGQRISFPNVGRGLGTVRLDGTDWKPVWPVSRANLRFNEYAWSPDGCQVAVVARRRLDDGQAEESIKVINLEDSSVTTLVSYTGPHNRNQRIFRPQWIPDGRGILYSSHIVNTHDEPRHYVVRFPPPESADVPTG